MQNTPKVITARLKGFIPATLATMVLWLGQWWLQMKGYITQDNADVILYVAIAVFIFGVLYMIWPWLRIYLTWQNIQRIRFRSPIHLIPGKGHVDIASLVRVEIDYKKEYERLKAEYEEFKRQASNPVTQSAARPSPIIATVLKAIDEARGIIPKGKDVPVYITNANGLTSIYPQEIKDILTKLQDDGKMIQLVSFPDWLLPMQERNQTQFIDRLSAAMDKSLNNFVVRLNDNFKSDD